MANNKAGDDQNIEAVNPLKDDKAEEPKAVDSVSEQLEKLNVGAESDGTKPCAPDAGGTKPSETQSAGDTVVASTSS